MTASTKVMSKPVRNVILWGLFAMTSVHVITDADDIADIPGSTYPQVVAAEQRSALSATGSFLDHVFDRSGYYASDDDGGAVDGYNKCLCLCDTRPVLPTFNGSGAGSQQG